MLVPLVVALPAAAQETGAAAASESASETTSGSGHSQRLAAASAKAADTGERIEVTALRTETAETHANPDGSFTTEQYALAQRVRKNGKLVDLDTDLVRDPNGNFSAKATEVQVTFSGGGEGPLATVTRDGRSMSWSWPRPLPVPTIEGDTAVYHDVLDDVDLKLRAGTAGFGQLLIVHNATAAANPALARIRLPLSTQGLDVDADEHGNLRAVDPAGQEVFTAPTPLMWDSTQPPAPGTQALTTPEHPPKSEPTPMPPAHEFEPPQGAREATVGVDVTNGEIALTPDQKVLAGPNTQYPVYIDPAVSGSREAWAIAYSSAPGTAFYNGNGWKEGDGNATTKYARVGNPGDGTSRSFFRMDTNNLWNTNKVISSSTFRIKNSYSYSCTHREVQTWLTGAVNSSTTWSNQPSWTTKLDTVSDAKGWSSSCPAGNLAFDVTAGTKQAATGQWNSLTLGLRAASEGDNLAYKRFDASTAVLSTTYNTVPNPPTGLGTVPSTGCDTTAPYPVIGNTDIYLTAKVSDADGGTVKAQFRLWGNNNYAGGAEIFNQLVTVTSGTVAKVKVPKATLQAALAQAGGVFGWKAQTLDATAGSTWVPTTSCRFTFDPNRPSKPPGVASTQFPNGTDGWPTNTSPVRTEGTFTFTNGGVTDVTKYEYWSDTDATRRTITPAAQGGSASVKITPTTAGSNQLYVKSSDAAGNSSDTATYLYYANGPTTADKAGDINGDSYADMWAIDATGTLRRFYGAGDGTLTENPKTASDFTFTGVKITHRGDWTNDAYEDLVALRQDTTAGINRLWVYPNNGFGFACTSCSDGTQRQELTVYDQANNHWKNGAQQILAIGDIDGGLDIDGDGTIGPDDLPGYPDLLVNDGQFLWLYYGAPDNRLDSYRDPVLLAAGDSMSSQSGGTLDKITLAAPGDFTDDGHLDLVARFEAGGLFLYDSINPDGPNGPDQTTPNHRIQIGSGWNTLPLLTASPDANNNGKPDLWATDTTGTVRFYGDYTTSGSAPWTTAATGFNNYQSIG
ncbi:VCBS repeat-containing protein [Streptomyces sp. NPDC005953]|uniref:VCBS repeat-containing protein n=1 Tax=Streptomyces sp. NPDC005953 TaxID=3156719 RepID=UPI0033CD32C5